MADAWRRGRVECLEQLAPVSLSKLAAALQHLRRWAADTGLVPSEVTYLAATRVGSAAVHRRWRPGNRARLAHTLDAIRPVGATRQREIKAQRKAPDLVVIEPLQPVDLRRLRRLGFAAVHGGMASHCAWVARNLTTWCSCPPATPP